jgi:hypothetical protein
MGRPSARGVVLLLGWFIGTVGASAYLHEMHYMGGAMAEQFREGPAFLLRPGAMVYTAGMALLGVASVVALIREPGWRLAPFLVFLLGGAMSALFVTDLFGSRLPLPRIEVAHAPSEGGGAYDTAVGLQNRGGRALVIDADSTQLNAFDLMVERQIGANSWEDVTGAEVLNASTAGMILSQGERATWTYRLAPGDYRVQLRSAHHDTVFAHSFSLDPLAAPVAVEPVEETAEVAEDSDPEEMSPSLLRAVAARAELTGVMNNADGAPKIAIRIELPNGRSLNEAYAIGETLYDEWVITEFNPSENTVTVEKNGTFLILRRRSPIYLTPNPVE